MSTVYIKKKEKNEKKKKREKEKEKKKRRKRKEETKNVFRVSLWKVTKVSVKYETNMIY